MKKGNEKNKLKLAFITLSIAFIVVVGAFLGVITTSGVNLNTGLNINYSVGQDVNGRLTGFYQYEGSDKVSMGEVLFLADETIDGKLESPSLKLSPQVQSVRFIYLFENLNKESVSIFSTWDDFEYNIDENGEEIEGVSKVNNKNVLVNSKIYNRLSDLPEEFIKENGLKKENIQLCEDGVGVIVITIAVANLNHNAYCHSDKDGGLTFHLTKDL